MLVMELRCIQSWIALKKPQQTSTQYVTHPTGQFRDITWPCMHVNVQLLQQAALDKYVQGAFEHQHEEKLLLKRIDRDKHQFRRKLERQNLVARLWYEHKNIKGTGLAEPQMSNKLGVILTTNNHGHVITNQHTRQMRTEKYTSPMESKWRVHTHRQTEMVTWNWNMMVTSIMMTSWNCTSFDMA